MPCQKWRKSAYAPRSSPEVLHRALSRRHYRQRTPAFQAGATARDPSLGDTAGRISGDASEETHMDGETVLVASSGGVTRLTLNRPEKLNAFTLAMHAELRAALEAAGANSQCRAIVLTGAGRAFCAGQDLAETRGR